jgi:hypothetical protein
MTEQQEYEFFIQYLAKKIKTLYAEWLTQKMVLQRLKDQQVQDHEFRGIDELLASARTSPEAGSAINDFYRVIDSKIQSSSEFEENQEYAALIQKFGLDGGLPN